jgi:hypothetical protein
LSTKPPTKLPGTLSLAGGVLVGGVAGGVVGGVAAVVSVVAGGCTGVVAGVVSSVAGGFSINSPSSTPFLIAPFTIFQAPAQMMRSFLAVSGYFAITASIAAWKSVISFCIASFQITIARRFPVIFSIARCSFFSSSGVDVCFHFKLNV